METNGTKPAAGEKPRLTRAEKLLDAKADLQTEKLLKSLGDLPVEQKLLIVAKQLTEHERDASRHASNAKQTEKQLEIVKREKENLQKEYNKGILMRDKLEQVCREQQKLMKSVKSECSTRIRDEEEKRKEITTHFQKSINEIYSTLNKNNEENAKLRDANLEMSKKFKFLAEQYEVREQQLNKTNERIELESQLNDAKLAKSKMEATIDKEVLLKEKETVLLDLMASKKLIIDLKETERILKGELQLYTEKYHDFQNAMQQSNDVFSKYKVEITNMAKRTKKLEKDNYDLRVKYEKCNKALLDMAGDKQEQDAYVAKAARQLEQLQKLCRTLQAERTVLVDVLTANNIERPAVPELPPAPVDIVPPPSARTDKLDIMSKNCIEMKQTIAALQLQMNSLNTKQEPAKPEPVAKPTKPKNKKPKNKANGNAKAAVQLNGDAKGLVNEDEAAATTANNEKTEAVVSEEAAIENSEAIAHTNGDTSNETAAVEPESADDDQAQLSSVEAVAPVAVTVE